MENASVFYVEDDCYVYRMPIIRKLEIKTINIYRFWHTLKLKKLKLMPSFGCEIRLLFCNKNVEIEIEKKFKPDSLLFVINV